MREAFEVRSVRDLILLWGDTPQQAYEAMAADLGEPRADHVPRDWARRGSIPAARIDAVVNAAQKRGFHDVTHAFVLRLVSIGASA